MIVYVPTPITSVEQAEALPEGTIAIVGEPPVESSVKWDDRLWYSGRDFDDGAPSRRMVGALALVPIEAKEETITVQTRGQAHPDWRTRLTTPWKWIDGPSPDRRGDCA